MRRTRAELLGAFKGALSTEWRTPYEVAEGAGMDMRTLYRLVEQYQDFLSRFIQGYGPLPNWFTEKERVYIMEVARRQNRIFALRLRLVRKGEEDAEAIRCLE